MSDDRNLFLIIFSEIENFEEAKKYFFPYWADEPSDEATDEEFEEWENNNPTWIFREEVEEYLDEDFLEINTELSGITSQIAREEDKKKIEECYDEKYKTFIILGNNAFKYTDIHFLNLDKCSKSLLQVGIFEAKS